MAVVVAIVVPAPVAGKTAAMAVGQAAEVTAVVLETSPVLPMAVVLMMVAVAVVVVVRPPRTMAEVAAMAAVVVMTTAVTAAPKVESQRFISSFQSPASTS